MFLWIIGANGMLGKVVSQKCKLNDIKFIASFKNDADISSLDSISRFYNANKGISHIINCAAFSHVDSAEIYPDQAYKINVLGPQNIGILSKKFSVPVIHISTEYVFSGNEGTTSFNESDKPIPRGCYAQTKREGELRILYENPTSCIIRTSWLFGSPGKTFLSTALENLLKTKILRVVSDQKNRPTYVHDLAQFIFFFLDKSGIYHFANNGKASKYEFLVDLLENAHKLKFPVKTEKIIPVKSNEFYQLCTRPNECVLDTAKVEKLLKMPIRHWKDCVREMITTSNQINY